MESTKGSRYDKSAIIYEFILEAEEPEAAWKYFFENADYIKSSEAKEVDAYFTAQQLQKYEKEYSDLIDGLLNKLVVRHCEKEEFYNELWEGIIKSNVICDEKNVKIYAIGRVWSDARIPYFCMKDGIKMSNEEFMGIIEEKKELLQEVTFILNRQNEQKTETGSMLVDVLGRCTNDKEKAVVMAKILDLIERRALLSIFKSQ